MEKYLKYKLKYLSLAGASGVPGIVIEDEKGNGYHFSKNIQKTCLIDDDGCWYFENYIPEGTYCLTKEDGTKKTIDDGYLKSIKDRIQIPSSILLGVPDMPSSHYDVIKINSINIINIFKNSITIEFNINIQRREEKKMRSRQYPPDNNRIYTKECQLSDILKSLGESDVEPITRKSLPEKKEELKQFRRAVIAASASPAPTSTEEAARTRTVTPKQREDLKQLRRDAKAAATAPPPVSPAPTLTEELEAAASDPK
jgi:hypothetical protein